MKTKTQEVIKEYLLENPSKRLEICNEIDSYDGSMEFRRKFGGGIVGIF